MIISVNLGIKNCALSAFVDGHPVMIAQTDYHSLPNKGDHHFQKLAIKTSPLDTYNLGRQCEIQIEAILNWAFVISSKSFPNHNELTALLSLPIGMASAAKSTLIYFAIKSGFTQAMAPHSLVSSAASSLYSIVNKGNCLVINIDGNEVSGCLLDIDDGAFEVLGHEFCLGSDTTSPFSGVSSVCANLLKRLTLGESVFGSGVDYILLSGFVNEIEAGEIKRLISSILKVNVSSIYFNRDAAAIGGGIQAGVIEGKLRDFLFLDCTTHSIFIHNDSEGVAYEQVQGMQQDEKMPVIYLMITHGTTTPTKKSECIVLNHSKSTNLAMYECAHEKIQSVVNRSSLLYECETIQSFSFPPEGSSSLANILMTVDIDLSGVASLALDREVLANNSLS